VGSDPADYNVLTGSGVTFNPTTKLGTVAFAANATKATVVVDPIADTIAEIANETVALTVNSGTGYIGGSPGTATGTIVSEETLPIFSNPNPITIPSSGTSTPYPSTINVSGLSGNINSLKVTLTNLSHTWPDDIDVLLVGPTGTKALLMSDVGGSSGVNNVTLTFDPTATSSLPDSGLITSGSYKATDVGTGDIFNAPAPGGPYGTDFSVFNNTNPNGTWSLYVMDDMGGDSGTIAGGWALTIGTGAATKSISIAKTTDGKEAGLVSSVFTLTRTGDLSSALTVNYTLAGTATLGSDYNDPSLGKATFLATADKATITLPTKDDLLSDPSETIITKITAPAGYTISGPDTATATILDNDGNSGNNNLVGTSLADALAGVGGNDTLSGLAGNDTLDGGADNDTYLFDTDLVLNSDLLIDASGIDTLNFAATTAKTINLNLGSIAAQTVTAGNLTLALASATAFENVIGGSLNDNIIGNTLANSLDGGAGNDTLNGGAGNDTYLFDTDLVLGSDLLIDASGIDTLNFAATTTKTINLNLGSIAAQTVTAGNLTLTLASATAFENVIGGSLNDNIIGNTLANSLSGGAGNDNLNGGAGNDTLTGGLGKDTLTGSTGLDTLTYNSLGESLLTGFDVIQGYSGTGASLDRINAPGSIAAINLTASKGTATALTEAAIQLVLTNAAFAANTAAAFKVTGQSGTFIALNNGVAGFQAASDAIIQLSGYNIAVATPVVVI
jgi:Ca2+-binding RTX toxin-like protein